MAGLDARRRLEVALEDPKTSSDTLTGQTEQWFELGFVARGEKAVDWLAQGL